MIRTYNVHIMCHRAKFYKNRLNRGRDMVIFIFFKMTFTAILDFQNFNFSTVKTVKRVELHHYAQFCRNRFNHGRGIAIFRYFKMAAVAIFDFGNLKSLTVRTIRRVNCIFVPNFVKIAQTEAEILRFFDFSRRRPPPCWILKISNL